METDHTTMETDRITMVTDHITTYDMETDTPIVTTSDTGTRDCSQASSGSGCGMEFAVTAGLIDDEDFVVTTGDEHTGSGRSDLTTAPATERDNFQASGSGVGQDSSVKLQRRRKRRSVGAEEIREPLPQEQAYFQAVVRDTFQRQETFERELAAARAASQARKRVLAVTPTSQLHPLAQTPSAEHMQPGVGGAVSHDHEDQPEGAIYLYKEEESEDLHMH